MNMSLFDLFKYMFKWKLLIVIVTILSLIVSYAYVGGAQSYSSSIVIKYTGGNASMGLAPDDSPLDVYEMISPTVISAALSDLGISMSVEGIRKAITITPIIPDSVAQIKETKEKNGEEYEYFPTQYYVSYTVSSTYGGTFARDMLDAIIKQYEINFSETHLSQYRLPEIDADTTLGAHDYIEIAEVLRDKIKDTVEFLSGRAESASEYRSPRTGYSFSDMLQKYVMMLNIKLPTVFSNIFRGQITLDREKLIKKYQYRKQQYLLEQQNKQNETALGLNLMKEFVISNRDVPNSYNDAMSQNNDDIATTDVILNENLPRTKTTYDDLVEKYVISGTSAGELGIDANYCDTVLAIYNSAPNTSLDITAITKQISDDIIELSEQYKAMYDITDMVIEDYNRYMASRSISALSSVGVSENLSVSLYMLIALIAGLGLGIVASVTIEVIRGARRKKKEDGDEDADESHSDEPQSDESQSDKPHSDKPQSDKSQSDKPHSDMPYSDEPHSDMPHSDMPHSDMPYSDMPYSDESQSDKSQSDEPHSDESHSDEPQDDEYILDMGVGFDAIPSESDYASIAELDLGLGGMPIAEYDYDVDAETEFDFSLPEGMPEPDWARSAPAEASEGLSFDAPAEASEGLSFDAPVEAPEGLSFDAPAEAPEGLSFDASAEAPEGLSFDAPVEAPAEERKPTNIDGASVDI